MTESRDIEKRGDKQKIERKTTSLEYIFNYKLLVKTK